MGILLFCLFFSLALPAQDFVDVLYLKNGRRISGTLQQHDEQGTVRLLRANGEIFSVYKKDVRKIDYIRLRTRGRNGEKTAENVPVYVPKKVSNPTGWGHQIDFSLPLGLTDNRSNSFRARDLVVGGTAAYHFLRQFPKMTVGLGPEYIVMSRERSEEFWALTALAEYRLAGPHRVQPYFCMDGGLAFPQSSEEAQIENPEPTLLLHPSLGTGFRAGSTMLTVDFGYQFMNVNYLIENPSLEVLERKISYRRFTLRVGMRL